MSRTLLVYLNVALLAVFLVVLSSGPDLDAGGQFHLVYISAPGPGVAPSPEEANAIQAVEGGWDTRVTFMAGGVDMESVARTLKRAIALEPDGISMPGGAGDALILTFVTEAQRRGIRVTFHDSPHPPAQRRFSERGTGFVGERGGSAGFSMAGTAMTRFNLSPETPVMLVGTGPAPSPGSRLEACKTFLESLEVPTEYLQVNVENENVDGLVPDVGLVSRLQQAPTPQAIFWEAGPVSMATSVVETIGLSPNDIHIVSFVPMSEPLPLLEAPYLKLQVQERPFLACYLSLVQLIMTDRYGFSGMDIPLGGA